MVSFATIELINSRNEKTAIRAESDIDLLVLPKAAQTFRFNVGKSTRNAAVDGVRYSLVNDEGQIISVKKTL